MVRCSQLHRPFMLSQHPVKIVFPKYFTYVAYLSRVNVQPASHWGDRPRRLFIRPGIVADLLSLEGSSRRILR